MYDLSVATMIKYIKMKYIPVDISDKSITLKLWALLSPPTANTSGISGFAARHCNAPKLVFFSHITHGSLLSRISHTLIMLSFDEVTNNPWYDELKDNPKN